MIRGAEAKKVYDATLWYTRMGKPMKSLNKAAKQFGVCRTKFSQILKHYENILQGR